MRPSIQKLPEELINLISAGEVVERPMSVVKELVENAIDAGSSNIEIELTDGGIKKIKVIDNGIGMKKDEIPVALSPHATSKIKCAEDLFNIGTLGFRGEALPSIVSVSDFNIQSRVEDNTYGFYYHYEYGKLTSSGTVPMPVGTIIEVENIFKNTPARFKHLSSVYTENAYITDYLYKCALSHPDISFKLSNNGKVLYDTNGAADLLEIISKTYSSDIAKSMISFINKNNLYTISGYTSNNQVFRSNKNSITILVNNRVIKNQSLIYAVTDAYKSIIPIGKYPITVLKINCSPLVIDVNVHPSKAEIRFTDEYLLKNLITKTLSDVLLNTNLVYQNVTNNIKVEKSIFGEQPVYDTNLFSQVEETKQPVLKEKESFDLDWDDFEEVELEKVDDSSTQTLENDFEDDEEEIVEVVTKTKTVKEQESFIKESRFNFSNMKYIGQFIKTYLLFEKGDELFLIDQHAAAERINYEKISKAFKNLDHNKITTELLVPIILNFSSLEIVKINKYINELKAIGLELEEFGGNSYKISVIPGWIIPGTEVESVQELINKIINQEKVNKLVLYDELAKSMSCKKSLKANMHILNEEVTTLLNELDKCEMPFTCPHGRPTLIKFTKYELEKLFKRVI